jgi:ferredoxin-NADP reductase
VQLTVEIDGVRRSRCYSPASSAHAAHGHLELTVKTHPEGLVSGYLAERAAPGTVIGLSAPDGDFALPALRPRKLVLISGGSGITPVVSMLRTLCDEGHPGEIAFVHYAPSADDALYRAELEEIAAAHPNVTLRRSYTRAPGSGELDGHFAAQHLDGIDLRDAEAFVCGPPALIDAARSHWAALELDARLHVESFVPPSLAIASDSAEGTLHFTETGATAENDGRTLLEQAEAAGLNPQFGCRMGICHTCTRRKSAGCVRNALTGEVSSGEEGDVELCVSIPVGDVAIAL